MFLVHLIGYFGGLQTLKKFPYKLMISVSLLYAISAAYDSFHGNALLSIGGGGTCALAMQTFLFVSPFVLFLIMFNVNFL